MQQYIEIAICDAELSSDIPMRHLLKIAEREDCLHPIRKPAKPPGPAGF
jgi:hypothetical protein